MASAKRLAELGMVPPLAVEVVRQINAGVGNASRLMELTMVAPLAKMLAGMITAGVGNVRRLVELGMVPQLASEVFSQINGRSPPGYLIVTTNSGSEIVTSAGQPVYARVA